MIEKVLDVGRHYSKKDLSEILNESNLVHVREGVYSCHSSNAYILFVNLNKDSVKSEHKFNDVFYDDVFHWDSQPKQSMKSKAINSLVTGERVAHLFARVYPKHKSKTNPFVYCGGLEYIGSDKEKTKPVHLTFKALDFKDDLEDGSPLLDIYRWKPSHEGRSSDYLYTPSKSFRKKSYTKPNKTEREGLVVSRVGQGWYREQLLNKWGGECPITGCNVIKILIASHIVPWSECKDEERLNVHNGILLSPDVDALFDRHLISFSDKGEMLLSREINRNTLDSLGVPRQVTLPVDADMKPFLAIHRSKLK
jgi:hypothetical protein